jgi:hypothetical protein
MASHLVTLGIPAIALLLAGAFVYAVFVSAKRAGIPAAARTTQTVLAALGVAVLFAIIAGLGLSGVLGRFELRPPPLVLLMVGTFAWALGVALSPLGRRLAALPLAALVGFQAFRLPLELLMHRAALEGSMPSVMSYGGYNYDIVSGITALGLGLALARGKVPRGVIVAWNALGGALLAVIVTVAVLATPLVRAFGDQQINTWVTAFPSCYITVMVGSALCGHALLARRLLLDASRPEEESWGYGLQATARSAAGTSSPASRR